MHRIIQICTAHSMSPKSISRHEVGVSGGLPTQPSLERGIGKLCHSLTQSTAFKCRLRKSVECKRWYKLIRGGIWHIGALSCHNAMNARKKGWQVKILSVFHAKEEVAGNNNEGVGNDKTPQTNGMQAQLWRDVEV